MVQGEGMVLKGGMQVGLTGVAGVASLGEQHQVRQAQALHQLRLARQGGTFPRQPQGGIGEAGREQGHGQRQSKEIGVRRAHQTLAAAFISTTRSAPVRLGPTPRLCDTAGTRIRDATVRPVLRTNEPKPMESVLAKPLTGEALMPCPPFSTTAMGLGPTIRRSGAERRTSLGLGLAFGLLRRRMRGRATGRRTAFRFRRDPGGRRGRQDLGAHVGLAELAVLALGLGGSTGLARSVGRMADGGGQVLLQRHGRLGRHQWNNYLKQERKGSQPRAEPSETARLPNAAAMLSLHQYGTSSGQVGMANLTCPPPGVTALIPGAWADRRRAACNTSRPAADNAWGWPHMVRNTCRGATFHPFQSDDRHSCAASDSHLQYLLDPMPP
ncbi:hypothetical protein MTBSS4_10181 [Magnetospirillum sp. SS-4]|nr:hypothetical protein MTBSS4_10181 [Magnetospirillum sp. SS-4]